MNKEQPAAPAIRQFKEANRFYINGVFDDEMEWGVIAELRKEIDTQASAKEGLIEFYIASNGGYTHVLYQIVELIELAKRKGVKVRTVVTSHAYSAGSMLAITGTKGERFISRYAEHLAHHGSFDGYRKTTPLQIERNAEHYRREVKMTLEHYKKYAEIPDIEEHLKDDDFWIPADKAIKWGLADKYMDELE